MHLKTTSHHNVVFDIDKARKVIGSDIMQYGAATIKLSYDHIEIQSLTGGEKVEVYNPKLVAFAYCGDQKVIVVLSDEDFNIVYMVDQGWHIDLPDDTYGTKVLYGEGFIVFSNGYRLQVHDLANNQREFMEMEAADLYSVYSSEDMHCDHNASFSALMDGYVCQFVVKKNEEGILTVTRTKRRPAEYLMEEA